MFHAKILNLIVALDYLPVRSKGVCYGFTMKWLEANFLDYDYFLSQMRYLEKNPDFIEKVKALGENNLPSTPTDFLPQIRKIQEIDACLKNIAMYQHPSHYYKNWGRFVDQKDIEFMSTQVASRDIKVQGGLVSIYSKPCVYNQQELKQYLQNLSLTVDKSCPHKNTTIGFLISSYDHVIGLTYNPGSSKWCLMEINDWSPNTDSAEKTFTVEIIAKKLFEYMNLNDSMKNKKTNKFVAFNAQIIIPCSHSDRVQLTTNLDQLKHSYYFSTESIVERQTAIDLLWIATDHGDVDIIEPLAKLHSSCLNIPNNEGNTVLIAAIQKGYINVVAKLLDCGASLDIHHYAGLAPLIIALANGNLAIIEKLLEFNADPNINYNDGSTPLVLAVAKGDLAIIEKLLKFKADPNINYNDGSTPLILAIAMGDLAIIEKLLESGANPNVANKHGETPLILAVAKGDLAIIKKLLEFEANPNITNKDGKTPLILAVAKGDLAIIKKLLEFKAYPNIKANDGNTPLYLAFIQGDIKIGLFLLWQHIYLTSYRLASFVFNAIIDMFTTLVSCIATREKSFFLFFKQNPESSSRSSESIETESLEYGFTAVPTAQTL